MPKNWAPIFYTMKSWMETVLRILTAIYDVMMEIKAQKEENKINKVSFKDQVFITKQQLTEKLNISESTYGRNIKSGLLRPIRLGGSDVYTEDQIQEALEESRRKGRT